MRKEGKTVSKQVSKEAMSVKESEIPSKYQVAQKSS